ncbi:MAG: SRPBCC domain-containing protein [Candidatus Acidiferrum sp.]
MSLQRLCRWLGGVLVAFLLLVFALHKDAQIQTDIWIERPSADVWQILTATDQYPSWNPFIHRLRGQLHPGSRIEVEIGPPDSNPMSFRPIVITVQEDREIRWHGSLWIRGLFDGEHSFLLESVGGRTHLFQAERFSGLLVGRLSDGILSKTQRGFAAMNEAVKERAESR